jgi:hypothetical protein
MDAGTYRSRRTRLLVILGVSMAVLVGTVAYAFSLESWGDTRGMVFNIVGFTSMAVGLAALVLLIGDFTQATPRLRRRGPGSRPRAHSAVVGLLAKVING